MIDRKQNLEANSVLQFETEKKLPDPFRRQNINS